MMTWPFELESLSNRSGIHPRPNASQLATNYLFWFPTRLRLILAGTVGCTHTGAGIYLLQRMSVSVCTVNAGALLRKVSLNVVKILNNTALA